MRTRWILAALIALLVLPLAVAAGALHRPRWYPVLDLAMTELRLRDVFTSHTPLIGLPGRIGRFPEQGSHPGPMSFYALWPAWKALGSSSWGMQVSALLLNAVAATGSVLIAFRRGGIRLAIALTALVALLMGGYGISTLAEPWNPYMPLLWWLLTLLAVWSVLSGDLPMLPVAVAAASMAAQTHVPYLGLCLGMGLVAVGGLVWSWMHGGDHRRILRWGGASLALAALLWSPLLVDQATQHPGNLSMLWTHFTSPPAEEGTPVGLGRGVELQLQHLNVVDFVSTSGRSLGSLATSSGDAGGSVVPGIVVLALWCASAVVAARRRHEALDRLNIVVGIGLVLGVFSMSRIFGKVWYYLMLWSWGTVALLLLSVGWTAWLVFGRERYARIGLAALVAIASVSSLLLCIEAADVDPPAPQLSAVLAKVVPPTARALDKDGRYLVTWDDSFYIGSQGYGLVSDLERLGYDVGVRDTWRVPVTRHRVLEPDEVDGEVHLAVGSFVPRWRAVPGARELAFDDPRDARERAEYDALRAEVVADLTADGRADEAELVDTNLFGLSLHALDDDTREAVERMLELGSPGAVFLIPPGTQLPRIVTDLAAVPVPGRLQAILETRGRDRLLVVIGAVLAALPIAVSTVRALLDGWVAIGDDADLLLRSRDVLTTAHHPLLGTWTSASLTIGTNINNPGSLLFDLLALPARVGGSGGFAVGVALLNIACIAGIAWFGLRVGGPRLALAGTAAAAALTWSMGSELLYDAWQPHSMLLPFLLLLVLVVAMALGDLVALPVAAGVASLIVQTHLSYAVLVPPLCAWGVGWLLYRHRRAMGAAAVVAALVTAVCWTQPLVDQVAGEHNLSTLVTHASDASSSVGPALGARLAADVLAAPPWWGRPSFGDALLPPTGQPPVLHGAPNIDGLPSPALAVLSLGGLIALLALVWWIARRRRDAVGRAAIVVAALALGAAIVASSTLPVGQLGIAPHQLRFLWPIATFTTAALAAILLPRRYVVGALLALTALLAVMNLPAHNVETGPAADADAIPVVRALTRQLDTLKDEDTVLYDTSGLRFAEPWTQSIMAAFQEQGIDFDVDDDGWVAQVGTGRRDHGAAKVRVFVREGTAATQVPAGARRVALVEGLDAGQADELARLERQLIDLPISLTTAGRRARDVGGLPSFEHANPTAEQLLSTGELAVLVRSGLVDVPSSRADDVRRYSDLRHRWDRHTVALFVEPR